MTSMAPTESKLSASSTPIARANKAVQQRRRPSLRLAVSPTSLTSAALLLPLPLHAADHSAQLLLAANRHSHRPPAGLSRGAQSGPRSAQAARGQPSTRCAFTHPRRRARPSQLAAILPSLKAQHALCISLAARLSTLHQDMDELRAVYTRMWRDRVGSVRNPFEDGRLTATRETSTSMSGLSI